MGHIKKIIVYWSIILIGEGRPTHKKTQRWVSLIPPTKKHRVGECEGAYRTKKKEQSAKKEKIAIAWRSQRELNKRENSNSLKNWKARIEKARQGKGSQGIQRELKSENWKSETVAIAWRSQKGRQGIQRELKSENWKSATVAIAWRIEKRELKKRDSSNSLKKPKRKPGNPARIEKARQ